MSQTTPGGPHRHVFVPAKSSVIAVPSPSTGPSSSGTQAGASSTGTQPNKDASFRHLELEERDEEEGGYAEEEEEQPEAADILLTAIRRMGIEAPKGYDHKRDKNFESWLKRIEYHLKATRCPEECKTSTLIF